MPLIAVVETILHIPLICTTAVGDDRLVIYKTKKQRPARSDSILYQRHQCAQLQFPSFRTYVSSANIYEWYGTDDQKTRWRVVFWSNENRRFEFATDHLLFVLLFTS